MLVRCTTAAHFHTRAGPYDIGAQIGLRGSLASPIQSPAKLTPLQVTQLEASQWYFNLRTHKNSSGKIRGQVSCH